MIKKIYNLIREIKKEWKYLISNQKPIVFDHLPKCGGSSINIFLTSAFPRRYVYGISGINPEKSVEEFKNLPEKIRFKTKLVYGHLANKLIGFVNPESVVAVVIREPVDRIISHYHYVKRNKEHYLHQKIKEEDIQLDEYCSHDLSDELQNWYVTHFTGLSISEVEKKPKEAVELALNNIVSNYHVIGFQDDIPSFIKELTRIAKINTKYKNKIVNRTHNRIKLKEVDQVTLDKISKKNFLDIELYNELISLREKGELKNSVLCSRKPLIE